MKPELKQVRTCQPKTIFIGQQKTTGQSFTGGQVSLTKRIYDVVAMRVRYFMVTVDVNDLSAYGALTWLLTSSALGRLSDSSFYIGTSSGANQTQQTEIKSDVIGWFGRGIQTGTGGNAVIGNSQAPASIVNNFIRFYSPQMIDTFDWNVIDLYGNPFPAFAHNYSIEVVIELYQSCDCHVDFIHQYS